MSGRTRHKLRTITGLTRQDLEDCVMSVCRDKIRPAIVPFFEVVRGVKDNKPAKDQKGVRL